MKTFAHASLLVLVLLSLPLFAAPPAAVFSAPSAPVTRIVLYPGSALVERAARVKAGAESLEITGLPANFDATSVRVEADGGIEIGELVWRDSARSGPLNAEEARLEATVRKLSDRLKAMDVERKAAERELKYLEALASPGQASAVEASGNPARALEVIRQGSLQAERRILEAETQKRDLEKELKAANEDLARIRPNVDSVRTLSVRLRAKNDGEVRLSYLFADAGWRPAYRALLDSGRGTLRLELAAQIAQRSGEDWSRVRLSLSTSSPRRSASGPQPYPWNVNLLDDARRNKAFAADAAAAMPAGMSRSQMRATQGPLFEVEVEQSEYATEYAIPGTVSLPADGRKVAVSLGGLDIPVKLELEIVPRLEKAAYLVARGELPDGVWPAGEMRLYRNGAFIGATNWNANQNGRKVLLLPFGRDDLIQVAHQPGEDQQGKSGFVGQYAERRITDTYDVTNWHRRAVDIVVLESSPVGRNDAVEIERRFTPAVSEEDWRGQKGVVAWKHTLDAGQDASFTADYRIRWPKDRQIIGLP
ncbi:MAG: mucoidy inhibitor MuiA family protein [Zoogloeaceae bacterium]|nr:mucoidy inhibitor MuiA family protein [Zoogloeaceae bacterium]